MRVEDQQLKSFLLDSDLITSKDLVKAEKEAKEKGQKLSLVLVEKKFISQDQLSKLYAYILGIPFVNLEKESIPSDILQIIPEPIAREHKIIAFKKENKQLEVAMLDPEDLQTIEFIKKKTDLEILPRLTSQTSIEHILKQYQKTLEAEFGELVPEGKVLEKEIKIIKERKGVPERETQKLEKIAQDLPIIKIVDTLLKHAVLQKASDIHIEPLEKEILVRYRIDGILHEAMVLPKQILSGIVARIKVLANLKLDEHRLPQDGRFKIETDNYKYSLRVSVLPIFDGEKVVMRLLAEESKAYTLEGLGLRGEATEIVHRNLRKPHGMILVTGPTGCGKTTTLYAMMDILNTPEVNISTIEDPIEYRMPRINQTQVKPKIGFTFANGLRSLLRQDPDIIMVGEIRDEETAGMAVHSALTGHLVLSTLHTNSAAGALPRLLDMKIEPYLVASTVNAILAQRLVRKLCPDCSQKYRLDKKIIASLEKQFKLPEILDLLKKEKTIDSKATWQTIEFKKPVGCKNCLKGYKGRIGIFETLEVDEEIGSLLAKRPTTDELENLARQKRMIFMHEDGFIKTSQGITTIDEILRVTKE